MGEDHDLFLIYYGEKEEKKKKYQQQANHYHELKGTKFNIIHQVYETHKHIIDKYDYVFIPDDDIFMYYKDICRLFELMFKKKDHDDIYPLWQQTMDTTYITHVGQRFIHNGGAEIFLRSLSKHMNGEVQFRKSICTHPAMYDKNFCDTFPHPVIVGGEKEIADAINDGDTIICWGNVNLNSMELPSPTSCIFNACADVRYQLELCDKYVDYVIACSTQTASAVCYDKPHTIILPGIEVKRLSSKENKFHKRRNLGIEDHDFLVGMIARIDEEKQQFLLVEAMRQLQNKNIKAIFVGDGPKMEYLKSQSPPNCLFVGHQDDIGEWWNILDCYCLLSLREGCPASLFEAMFCKVPIISTQVGSVGDLLDKNNSIIIDDLETLTKAIAKIQNGDNSSMVQSAFDKFFEHGLVEDTAEAWTKIIRKNICLKKMKLHI
jgi:glycosyltransferase involved in cell wall biosynthesis